MFIIKLLRPSPKASPLVNQRGLTMIELILFIVIVSVALAGVLSVLNITTKSSADPMIRKQMLSIAEALLEEVASQPFTYCDPDDTARRSTANDFISGGSVSCTASYTELLGPETVGGTEARGNVPPALDNVNDYSGIASANLLTDISRNYPLPSGYAASIAITATDSLGPTPASALTIVSDAVAKTMTVLRIGVTVTHGSESLTLEGYRTRYSPNS